MKKFVCLVLILCWVIQFSTAQTKPIEIYSAYRYYKSDKTKTGVFKYRHFINLKPKYIFSFYSDRIILKSKNIIVFKIHKTKKHLNSTDYLVDDPTGQYFDIVIESAVIDSKHYYDISLLKTDKNGNWLSDTRFNVNRVK
ncbi:MAG: hypothetical protein ACHQF4_10635 [Sphingobacteriales bacterium]